MKSTVICLQNGRPTQMADRARIRTDATRIAAATHNVYGAVIVVEHRRRERVAGWARRGVSQQVKLIRRVISRDSLHPMGRALCARRGVSRSGMVHQHHRRTRPELVQDEILVAAPLRGTSPVIWNMEMKAREKEPNATGLMSRKRLTLMIASAGPGCFGSGTPGSIALKTHYIGETQGES